MFDAGAIVGKMKLDSKGWDSSVEKIQLDSLTLRQHLQKNAAEIRRMGMAFTAMGVAATAAFSLIVRQGMQEEAIYFKLEKQIENLGFAYQGVMGDVRNFTKQMQNLTAVGDEQVAMVLMRLLPYTKSLDEAYSGIAISLDMAAAGLFDMNTAARYVGMALSGNVEMLGRYIPELRSTTNEKLKLMSITEKSTYALELLRQKFGGIAEQEARTLQGALRGLRASIGDIAEASSKDLMPLLTKISLMAKNLAVSVETLAEKYSTLSSALVLSVGVFGVLATLMGGFLLVLPSIAAGVGILGTTFLTLLGVLVGLSIAVGAVYIAFNKWGYIEAFLWSFAEGVNFALAEMLQTLDNWIKKLAQIPLIGKLFRDETNDLTETINNLRESAKYCGEQSEAAFKRMADSASEVPSPVEDINGALSDLEAKVRDFAAGVETGMKKVVQDIQDFSSFAAQILVGFFNSMETMFSNVFFDIFTGDFDNIKQSFADFGKEIIKMMAQIVARILMYFAIIQPLVAAFPQLAPALGMGGFQEGLDYVPSTGMYKLHAGEKVTRASEVGERTEPITIYNMITPEAVAGAMAGREGEGIIVNVIDRNSLRGGAIQKTIRRR